MGPDAGPFRAVWLIEVSPFWRLTDPRGEGSTGSAR